MDRKFHDLQNTSLDNSINSKKIHPSLSPLKWKTSNFEDPKKEISMINKILKELEKNEKKIMLITNYNFISSISSKRIYTISRTYDDISFPDKQNKYYQKFKNFFVNKIKKNDISVIYLVFEKDVLEFSTKRYVYEYFNSKCFNSETINDNLLRLDIKNCKNFK